MKPSHCILRTLDAAKEQNLQQGMNITYVLSLEITETGIEELPPGISLDYLYLAAKMSVQKELEKDGIIWLFEGQDGDIYNFTTDVSLWPTDLINEVTKRLFDDFQNELLREHGLSRGRHYNFRYAVLKVCYFEDY